MARQTQPELKQFRAVFFLVMYQRKHLGVPDAFARGHPLHIAPAIPAVISAGIVMVHDAVKNNRDGFKPAVSVDRESRDALSVIQPPRFVHIQISSRRMSFHIFFANPLRSVSFRIQIHMVHSRNPGIPRIFPELKVPVFYNCSHFIILSSHCPLIIPN